MVLPFAKEMCIRDRGNINVSWSSYYNQGESADKYSDGYMVFMSQNGSEMCIRDRVGTFSAISILVILAAPLP